LNILLDKQQKVKELTISLDSETKKYKSKSNFRVLHNRVLTMIFKEVNAPIF